MTRSTALFAAFALGIFAFACSSSPSPAGTDTHNNSASNSSSGGGESTTADAGTGSSSSNDGTNSNSSPTNPPYDAGVYDAPYHYDAAYYDAAFADGATLTTDASTACETQAAQANCIQCCMNAHPQGQQLYTETYRACICQGMVEACASQCATSFCAPVPVDPQTGDACDSCLKGNAQGRCGQITSATCSGNADCTALNQCVQTSGCLTKP